MAGVSCLRVCNCNKMIKTMWPSATFAIAFCTLHYVLFRGISSDKGFIHSPSCWVDEFPKLRCIPMRTRGLYYVAIATTLKLFFFALEVSRILRQWCVLRIAFLFSLLPLISTLPWARWRARGANDGRGHQKSLNVLTRCFFILWGY